MRDLDQIRLSDMKRIAAALTVLLLIAGPATSHADEADRKGFLDTVAKTANDLGTLRDEKKTIDGTLAQPAHFKIALSTTSMINVVLPAKAGLELHDAKGNRLERDTAARSEQKINRGLHAGVYYLSVVPEADTSSSYKLTLEISTLAEYGHYAIAFEIPATLSTTVFADRFPVGKVRSYKWARFDLEESGELRVDLHAFDNRATLDFAVFHNGDEISDLKTKNGAATFQQIVQPGEYYLRASNGGFGDVQFRLDVRMIYFGDRRVGTSGGSGGPSTGGGEAVEGEMRNPTIGGSEIARYGRWVVGRNTSGESSYCFAYTAATAVSPSGWRSVRPILYFQAGEGASGVSHYFDKANHYRAGRPARATVSVDGKATSIPIVRFGSSDPQWRTLVRCGKDKKSWCVDSGGLRALTKGTQMVFSGTSKRGSPTTITYDVRDYADAVRRMTATCASKTQWLVKN